MPREHVYGNFVTVSRGDLAVLATRTPADLAAVRDLVPASAADEDLLRVTADVADRVDVLRRRHQLLSRFAEDVDAALDAGGDGDPLGPARRELRTLLTGLRSALDRLPLTVTTNEGGDLVPAGPGVRRVTASGVDARPDPVVLAADDEDDPAIETRRVQLRVSLGWERDGGQVVLGVDGWDHDRAEAVDLGGLRVTLGWIGLNQLLRKTRAGRDQSCGTPE